VAVESGNGWEDFAGAVVFFEFSDDEVTFAGGVFSLLARELSALIDFDGRRIAEEIVGLMIAFVLESYRRRCGDSAASDRCAGIREDRRQQQRKSEQKNDKPVAQMGLQKSLVS